MKIKEYEILRYASVRSLQNQIKLRMDMGFQPYGHPYISEIECVQAMVKYDEESGWTQPYSIKPIEKERKIVNCFATDFRSSYVANEYEKSLLDDNDGWETIYKKEGKLKMVKYE